MAIAYQAKKQNLILVTFSSMIAASIKTIYIIALAIDNFIIDFIGKNFVVDFKAQLLLQTLLYYLKVYYISIIFYNWRKIIILKFRL